MPLNKALILPFPQWGKGLWCSFLQNLPYFVVERFHTTFLLKTYCKINLLVLELNYTINILHTDEEKLETQDR